MATLEQEFVDFFAECKKQGFSDDEMRAICQPLLQRHRNRYLAVACVVLAVFGALCLLYNWCDEFSWFVSAIGRLLLIQVLPYWDWTPLYNSRCLIERTVYKVDEPNVAPTTKISERYETEATNCVLCETLGEYCSRNL